jgi:hypothetical protein
MSIPASWALKSWPPDVYPNGTDRARRVLREHRDELLAAGSLARVGRELVVIGSRYQRWLERRTAHVPVYVCHANRARESGA